MSAGHHVGSNTGEPNACASSGAELKVSESASLIVTRGPSSPVVETLAHSTLSLWLQHLVRISPPCQRMTDAG